MATTFKTLTANDIVNTRTLLHEAIPLTGTILSGTYSDNNIKTYTLRGAYPTEVSTIDLNYATNDEVESFTVTFGYQYFEARTTT